MQRPKTGGAWRHDEHGKLVPDVTAAPVPAAQATPGDPAPETPADAKPGRRRKAADTPSDAEGGEVR